MKAYAADILTLVLGLLVMALLLLLGALSESWIALPCFLAVAVVYHTWFRHLVLFVQRLSDIDLEVEDKDDDDEDIFPTA
ncbi:MAG: hypothetical protein QME75_12635 [Deltaproteobacteria bacterium]|nr:hypothetical protein [Deltaproteobacteria bacterium]